jgi:hypothetical protein
MLEAIDASLRVIPIGLERTLRILLLSALEDRTCCRKKGCGRSPLPLPSQRPKLMFHVKQINQGADVSRETFVNQATVSIQVRSWTG